MVDEPLDRTCRDAGYPVLVYTVNEPERTALENPRGCRDFHRSTGFDYKPSSMNARLSQRFFPIYTPDQEDESTKPRWCGLQCGFRRGGRVAEGAPLLREYRLIPYRGFESLSLRHTKKGL